MSFTKRFFLLCPLFGVSFIEGSTVLRFFVLCFLFITIKATVLSITKGWVSMSEGEEER